MDLGDPLEVKNTFCPMVLYSQINFEREQEKGLCKEFKSLNMYTCRSHECEL